MTNEGNSEDKQEEKQIEEEAKTQGLLLGMTVEEWDAAMAEVEKMPRPNAFWGPFEATYGGPVVNGQQGFGIYIAPEMSAPVENQPENDEK